MLQNKLDDSSSCVPKLVLCNTDVLSKTQSQKHLVDVDLEELLVGIRHFWIGRAVPCASMLDERHNSLLYQQLWHRYRSIRIASVVTGTSTAMGAETRVDLLWVELVLLKGSVGPRFVRVGC